MKIFFVLLMLIGVFILFVGLTFLSSINFSEPTQLYGNNIEFIPVLLGCAGVIIGGAIIFITVRLMK